ncbi:MAG TPA: MAB_1171c family putative transporter [Rugosimonospora sp.]|nr:MAB_1171c family putative transporter [Rugosimonospora sp.]
MTVQAGIRLALLAFSSVALLVRSPSVFSRRARPMWLALLALTVELLLLQQPVAIAVDRFSHLAYFAVFAGGYCHMALTMVIWTVTAADPRRSGAGYRGNAWRWWFAGCAVAVILPSEIVATIQQSSTRVRALPQPTQINGLTLAWTAYLCFIAVSSSDATVRLWRQLRVTAFPTLRLALAILGVGTTASLVYVVGRAVTLVTTSPGASEVVLYSSTTYFLCFTAGCVTVLAGPLIEAVVAWRQRCRLFHLWRSVTSAVPDVVFEECPSLWQDVRRVRGNKIRLHRRVVEIQDAALALREWVTPEQASRFADEVAALGLTGEEADATVAARCLDLGRAAKQSGMGRSDAVPDISTGGGADIGGELRWLMLVRRAYREGSVEPTTSAPAR